MSTAIYDRVKALCRERGISVMQLSLDAGLHEDTIRFWGRGQGKPRASTVKLVADRLGVTPTYLRYGDGGEVAERIRLLRMKNGMSCVALADAIGCSPDSIYNRTNSTKSLGADAALHGLRLVDGGQGQGKGAAETGGGAETVIKDLLGAWQGDAEGGLHLGYGSLFRREFPLYSVRQGG